MSMSTHVKGFTGPDDRWRKMKAIWDACQDAGVDPPTEVERFFDGEAPDPNGREVQIPHEEWRDEHREGVEVRIKDLPKNVTVIRVYNSW
ncbi:hypothetical protein [Streptomyces sp. IBSBF 2950]|uniref:hypothetical protein n=1 Tax=Streptomyces sp. IBSBF 2950 TaxID=2903528 RepID=UPI002FDBBB35